MVLRFVVDVHTTCFGLHGHLQVCMIFNFLFLKESASMLLLPLLHATLHVSAYMAIFRCVWYLIFYSWRHRLRCFCCLCCMQHYMFRPTWPSSGVYDIYFFIPEGICFAAFVAFVACNTTCFGLHGHLQVCMIFNFLFLKASASMLLLPLLHA
jgi:hypothetical protein